MNNNFTDSEKLFHLLRRCGHSLGRGHGGGHGKGHGEEIGHGQLAILSIVSEKTSISQKELLETVGVRAASLSEVLSKMESSGYITREKDTEDSRAVNVTITEEGKALSEKMAAHRKENAETLFSALNEEEKAALIGLLEKLAESLNHGNGADDNQPHCHGHHHNHRDFQGEFEGEDSVHSHGGHHRHDGNHEHGHHPHDAD
ncbi:hypothetical protein AGMMS50284_5210 [Clostridia bacterium]|nr:hypothetical protein AGMMS50284_5210 [Clostridia bacterium]